MSNQDNSYLANLTFDEKLKKMPVAWYLGNIRLVILVLLSVIGLGIFSFFTMPRELNPSIDITIISVSTVLPGASPEDVESLVTVPIEDAVSGLDDLEKITSTSRENLSSVTLEFKSSMDRDKAQSDVQSAVDGVSDLPEDANDPMVRAFDFEDQPVWIFSLSAGEDIPGLQRFAKRLRDRIEEESLVDRVEISGLVDREVQVVIRPDIVREKGVSPMLLSQAISSALSSYPAGTINTDTLSFSLTIEKNITSIEDIRNTRITLQGEQFTIGEIATVTENASPSESRAFEAYPGKEPTQIVTFAVYKADGQKINEVANRAKTIVEEETADFDHIQATTIQDIAGEIDDQFISLGRSFGSTVLLVFLVMFLFLGIREAFLSSLSIPLAVLIGFFVMLLSDISLNFISLFSLILALGLLVDNAIVIVSAVNAYYRTGKFTPYETGLLVFKDYFIALLSTNITTVWAFFPLILATGIIGEFIEPIPIIVSTTIIASALVGFFLSLPIATLVLAPSLPRRVKMMFGTIVMIIVIAMVSGMIPPAVYTFIPDVVIPWEPQNIYLAAFIGYINTTFAVILNVLNALIPFLLIAILIGLFFYALGKIMGKISSGIGSFARKSAHISRFQKGVNRAMNRGFISIDGISRGYKRRMNGILSSPAAQWKVIFIVIVFFVISALMPVLGLVQNIFFPGGNQDIVYVSVELPSGTNVRTAEQEALSLMPSLIDTPELKFVSAEIGQVPPESQTPPSDNLILFTLNLVEAEDRTPQCVELKILNSCIRVPVLLESTVTSTDIAQSLRMDLSSYQNGKVSVVELSDGPPAGADIQIKYFGSDLERLNEYANDTIAYLESVEKTANVDKSIKSGTSKFAFAPDSKKMNEYGITESDIGLWLRSFASGFTLEDIEIDDEEYDIVFRLNPGNESPGDLGAVSIPTQQGYIPLTALGTVELQTNPTVITREDEKRTISVTASVTEGGNTGEIGRQLERYADGELGLEPGYTWQTGGVNEENQESLNSIFQAMILSALLILITLVIQLGAFRKAIIVMLVIPLAVSGVLILFALFGIPLSFPAMIGMLALFGIVVNNSILVVEKINQNIDAGFDLQESIADASASRLEPIMLTSMTSIIGLVPITISDPTWEGLGGAIICGLVFSGTLMLFFIPTVYWMWFATPEDRKKAERR